MANLITLSDYKQIEGLSSPKDDYRIGQLIDSVSQLVKTYCGNSIVDYYSTDKLEEFSIKWNTPLIQLTESPVVSISSVQIRGGVGESYQTLTSEEYYLDSDTDTVYRVGNGTIYRDWPQGPGSVKIAYRAGYEECPKDLRLAVVDLIKYYLKDEHVMRRSISGATLDNQGTGDGRGFPDHIKRILDMYKNF